MRALLEREEDLAELDRALARARAGAGQVIAVEGPGGIGKTSLLAAARARGASQGMLVAPRPRLGARARVPVRRRAPAVRACRQATPTRHFTGAAGLAKPIFDLADERPRSPRYARLHGLYWLCANLAAEQPLRRLRRRRPVGGRAEPELPGLPAAAPRGPPDRAAGRHAPAGRAGVRRACARSSPTPPRAVLRPTALSGDAVARLGPRRRRRPSRRRRSAAPATRPPAATRSSCRELLHEVTHKRLKATDAGGRGGARARPRGDLHAWCCSA